MVFVTNSEIGIEGEREIERERDSWIKVSNCKTICGIIFVYGVPINDNQFQFIDS